MWKTFNIGNEMYMMKINVNEDNYQFYVTDLKEIWSVSHSGGTIIRNFKEFNPKFDVEDDKVISEVIQLLNGIGSAIVEINTEEGNVSLKIRSEVSDMKDSKFSLKYELKLSKESVAKFSEIITIPMVRTIDYLEMQIQKLCNVIRKKDRELLEYKLETGSISRSDLPENITGSNDALIDESLSLPNDESLFLNTFGMSLRLFDHFNAKNGDVKTEVKEDHVDPSKKLKRKRKIYNAKTAENSKIVYKYQK